MTDFHVDNLVALAEFSQLTTPTRDFEIVTFAELEPHFTKPRFLIYPLLPRGEVTLLDGDDGTGKSWLWQAWAAGLTGSRIVPIPFDHTAPKGCRVLVLTCEDDLLYTAGPRMKELGADLSRVAVIKPQGCAYVSGITAADLQAALPRITAFGPDLLVVDHLTLYGTGRAELDLRRDTHARELMEDLKALAKSLDAAVLLIRHFRKQGGSAKDRGLNSVAFRAAARSHLVAGLDPEDPQAKRRLLKQLKMNLVPKLEKAIAFALDPDQEPPFAWLGLVEADADVIAGGSAEVEKARQEKSEREEAKEFLREMLSDGPKLAEVVQREADRLGISGATLRR
ncbi:MAG: AAA family ATPase, partial [Thermoleophilia bacterium]|nr:AAA family ATPase [Thermoleophilia bacterium]